MSNISPVRKKIFFTVQSHLLFLATAILKYNSHKIHPFKIYNSVVLDIVRAVQASLIPEHPYHSRKNGRPIGSESQPSLSLPRHPTRPLCPCGPVCFCHFMSGNHKVGGFWLLSHSMLFSGSYMLHHVSVLRSFFFWWIIVHCMGYSMLIHSSVDRILVISTFWLLWRMLLWILTYRFLCGHSFQLSWMYT